MTNVYDRILKEPREKIWLEGGFTVVGDAEWVSVSTQFADFEDAVVFVNLSAIPGDTSNDGFAVIARVRAHISRGL